MSSTKENMQQAARAVVGVVGNKSFALLVFDSDAEGGICHYISNGNREDVWRAVAEWVLKTSHKPLGDS